MGGVGIDGSVRLLYRFRSAPNPPEHEGGFEGVLSGLIEFRNGRLRRRSPPSHFFRTGRSPPIHKYGVCRVLVERQIAERLKTF